MTPRAVHLAVRQLVLANPTQCDEALALYATHEPGYYKHRREDLALQAVRKIRAGQVTKR